MIPLSCSCSIVTQSSRSKVVSLLYDRGLQQDIVINIYGFHYTKMQLSID